MTRTPSDFDEDRAMLGRLQLALTHTTRPWRCFYSWHTFKPPNPRPSFVSQHHVDDAGAALSGHITGHTGRRRFRPGTVGQ